MPHTTQPTTLSEIYNYIIEANLGGAAQSSNEVTLGQILLELGAAIGADVATPTAPLLFGQADNNNLVQINRASADGSVITPLTSGSAYHSWRPKTSPSGSTILFNRTPSTVPLSGYDNTITNGASFSLWTMDANGGNPTEIMAPGAIVPGGLMATPAWLSDGRIMVELTGTIYIMNPDGTGAASFTTSPVYTDWSDVCCSPDGTTLVGQRSSNAGAHNLYSINLASGVTTQLTSDGGGSGAPPSHFDPQYTPDGNSIMFETKTSNSGNFGLGLWQIEKMRVEAAATRTIITPTTGVCANPVADLDGWVYLQYLGASHFNVGRVRFDGSSTGFVGISNPSVLGGYPDVNRTRAVPSSRVGPPLNVLVTTFVSSAYTFALSDQETQQIGNAGSPATYTVPADASVSFPIGTVIEVTQQGAGKMQIAAAGGVNINASVSGGFSSGSTGTRAQYSVIRLLKQNLNQWVLSGDAA